MAIDPADVAAAHDLMADEYDQLDDLWYPWLAVQVHELIATDLQEWSSASRIALDVGCGTGFQSFLAAQAGFSVTGIDLSPGLIRRAIHKAPRLAVPPLMAPPLFDSCRDDPWIARHHRRLAELLERARSQRPVQPPAFVVADLHDVDFAALRPDVIICCGSVLSFVDDYPAALARMAGSLRRGGRLYLEVEQRWNADLVHPVVDKLLGGRFGFAQSWREIARNLAARPGRSIQIGYPYRLRSDTEVVLPMRLFSVWELMRIFGELGLVVRRRLGIHQLTNLIPSTLLHRPAPPTVRARVFEVLRALDSMAAATFPFWRLGCSVAVALEKA